LTALPELPYLLRRPGAKCKVGKRVMPDWVWLLLILAGYIALMRWVLPAMGVGT